LVFWIQIIIPVLGSRHYITFNWLEIKRISIIDGNILKKLLLFIFNRS
jgi:hypothetical protein